MKKHQIIAGKPGLSESDIKFLKELIWNQFDHPDLIRTDEELIGIAMHFGFDDLVKEMKDEVRHQKGWKIHRNDGK